MTDDHAKEDGFLSQWREGGTTKRRRRADSGDGRALGAQQGGRGTLPGKKFPVSYARGTAYKGQTGSGRLWYADRGHRKNGVGERDRRLRKAHRWTIDDV